MSLAKQLTYGFALVLVAGACGETIARLDDYWRLGIPLLAVPGFDNLVVTDSAGTHGAPNGRYRDIRLNSGGFRSPESALAASTGCVRVMTLGASETLGTGSGAAGNEYPAQLGDTLATHGCYHVLNAGMIGISLPSLVRFWDGWASRFHPDVVVVLSSPSLYLADQIARRAAAPAVAAAPVRAVPPPAGRFAWLQFSPHVESRLLERVHLFLHYPDFIQEQRVQNVLHDLTAGHSADWFFSTVPTNRLAFYGADLDSIVSAIRGAGAEPVLVAYPMRFGRTLSPDDSSLMAAWRGYSPRPTPQTLLDFMWAARDTLLDVARRRNVRVVDVPPTLNGHAEYFDDQVHYSAIGAKKIAGLIAPVVMEVRPPRS